MSHHLIIKKMFRGLSLILIGIGALLILQINAQAQSISVSASPLYPTLAPGSSISIAINVTRTSYTGSVSLTLMTTLPAGVTVTYTHPSTGNIGYVNLTASTSCQLVSNYEIRVQAYGSGVTAAYTSFWLTVSYPPGIATLDVTPTSVTLAPGGNVQLTATITRESGFTGSVSLQITSTLPSGVTASYVHPGTGNIGTITLTASTSCALVVNQTVTVRASATGVASKTDTFLLTTSYPPGISSLSVSPTSVTVAPGGSVQLTATITRESGFTGSVSLQITSALPSGITATYIHPLTGNTGTITLTASTSCELVQDEEVTVRASATGVASEYDEFLLTTSYPQGISSFSVNPTSVILVPGGTIELTATITRVSGFTGSVSLLITSTLPSGVTATYVHPLTSNTGTITLSASTSCTLVTGQTITVRASATGIASVTDTFLLTTGYPPGISAFDITPSSVTLAPGGATELTAAITRVSGFTGSVTILITTALPTGVSASYVHPLTGNTGTVILTASTSCALVDNLPVTVRASSTGIASVDDTFELTTSNPPGISVLNILPASITLHSGESSDLTATITRETGFVGNVTLTIISTLPTGISASITQPGTGNIGVITVSAGTSIQLVTNQSVTVRASSPGIDYIDDAFLLSTAVSSIQVTLRDQNGVNGIPSSTRFVLNPGNEIINSSNPATYLGLGAGEYQIDGYSLGPFGNYEYWGSTNVSLMLNETESTFIDRDAPYAQDFWLEYRNERISSGDNVPVGETLAARVVVQNRSSLNRSVYAVIGWKIGIAGTQLGTLQAPQIILNAGSQTEYLFDNIVLPAGLEGEIFAYVEVFSYTSTWLLTDNWDWTLRGNACYPVEIPPLQIPSEPDQNIWYTSSTPKRITNLCGKGGSISVERLISDSLWQGGPISLEIENHAYTLGLPAGSAVASDDSYSRIRIPINVNVTGFYRISADFALRNRAPAIGWTNGGIISSAYIMDYNLRLISESDLTEECISQKNIFNHENLAEVSEEIPGTVLDIVIFSIGEIFKHVGLVDPGAWGGFTLLFDTINSLFGESYAQDPELPLDISKSIDIEAYLEAGRTYKIEIANRTYAQSILVTHFGGAIQWTMARSRLTANAINIAQIADPGIIPNHTPTDLSLELSEISENLLPLSFIGEFLTNDQDIQDQHTYTLVAGTGSEDNALFSIIGKNLQTATPLDYEAQNTFYIRVRTTDQSGLFYEKAFEISIINESEQLLSSPDIVTPGDGTGGLTDSFNLIWTDGNDAPQEEGFRIRFKISGGEYIETAVGPNATSYHIANLVPGSTYYWNVKAIGNGSSTIDSEWGNLGVDWTFSVSPTVQQAGLQVFIEPLDAITAGAQWRVDGGEWRDSGTIETGLTAGISHTVNYYYMTGWTPPLTEAATISSGEVLQLFRTYTPNLHNNAPETPLLLSPEDGLTGIALAPALLASNYYDPDDDVHANTQWQVDDASDFISPVWDSGDSFVASTTTTIPAGLLTPGTTYYWRVRYKDSEGAWSHWSAAWSFVTREPEDNIAAKIAYISTETGNAEVYVLSLDAHLAVISNINVTNLPDSSDDDPCWSPTGDRIAYRSTADGTYQIWIMNADGSGKYKLTSSPAVIIGPTKWSNDGLYIYGGSAPAGDNEVVRVSVATGEITYLTNVPSYNTQDYDLNAEQTRVAYVRGLQGNGWTNQLYIADFTFSDNDFINKELFPDAVPAPHSPQLSPSGTRIAFSLDEYSGHGIGIINTDKTGFWAPISVGPDIVGCPAWLDENRIIYTKGPASSQGLYILDLRNLTSTLITDLGGEKWNSDILRISSLAEAEIFDDFEDGNMDGWTVAGPTVTVTTENKMHGEYSLKLDDNTASASADITRVINLGSNRIGLEFYEWTNDYSSLAAHATALETTTESTGWGFYFGALGATQGYWRYVDTQDKSAWGVDNLWATNSVDFPDRLRQSQAPGTNSGLKSMALKAKRGSGLTTSLRENSMSWQPRTRSSASGTASAITRRLGPSTTSTISGSMR